MIQFLLLDMTVFLTFAKSKIMIMSLAKRKNVRLSQKNILLKDFWQQKNVKLKLHNILTVYNNLLFGIEFTKYSHNDSLLAKGTHLTST